MIKCQIIGYFRNITTAMWGESNTKNFKYQSHNYSSQSDHFIVFCLADRIFRFL